MPSLRLLSSGVFPCCHSVLVSANASQIENPDAGVNGQVRQSGVRRVHAATLERNTDEPAPHKGFALFDLPANRPPTRAIGRGPRPEWTGSLRSCVETRSSNGDAR